MIKFVLNRGLSRPLFYSRVPAMEYLLLYLIFLLSIHIQIHLIGMLELGVLAAGDIFHSRMENIARR